MKKTKDELFESIIRSLELIAASEKSRRLRSTILDEHERRVQIYPVDRLGNLDEVPRESDSAKTKQLDTSHSSEFQSDTDRYYHPRKTTVADPVEFRLDYRNKQGQEFQGEWIEFEPVNYI